MMTFEELLKVFTWLVGFPYQLFIISALTLESILQILGENKQKICRVSYNKQIIRRTIK